MEKHKARQGQPTRDQVLDVAADLIEQEGYSSLSARGLGARLGTSRQIVASRFGSMDGLLQALYQRGFMELADEVRAVSVGEPSARLERLASAYWAHATTAPQRYRLMFDAAVTGFEPDEQSRLVARDAYGLVVEASEAWVSRAGGDLSGPQLAAVLWATAHGLVGLHRSGMLPPEHGEEVMRAAVRRLAPAIQG